MSGLFDANGKFRPLQWTLMLWFRDFHEDLQSIERAAANLSAITHIQLNSNHDNVFDEAEGTELVDAFSKIVETKNTWNGVKITNMSDHCINPWVAPMLLCLFENAITVDNVTIIGRDPDERIPFFEAIQKGVHKVAKLNLTLCSLSPALVRILSAGLTIGPEIPTTIVFPSNKGISDSTTVDALAEEIYKWNRVKKLDFMFSQLSNDDIQTMVTGLCRAGNDSQLTCLLLPAETHLNTCVLNSLGTLIRTSPSLEGLCCKMIIVDNDSSSNVDCTEFSQALAHPSTRLEWINMGGEISSANYVLLADAMATNRWMKNLSADLPRGSSDFALMETLQALRCALEQNKKSSLITVSVGDAIDPRKVDLWKEALSIEHYLDVNFYGKVRGSSTTTTPVSLWPTILMLIDRERLSNQGPMSYLYMLIDTTVLTSAEREKAFQTRKSSLLYSLLKNEVVPSMYSK